MPNLTDEEQIERVKNRIDGWIRNQEQNNSKIFITFLKLLSRTEQETVKYEDLKNQTGLDDSTFRHNFDQMKNNGDKNTGKVFEEIDGNIKLWEPVKEIIMNKFLDKIYNEYREFLQNSRTRNDNPFSENTIQDQIKIISEIIPRKLGIGNLFLNVDIEYIKSLHKRVTKGGDLQEWNISGINNGGKNGASSSLSRYIEFLEYKKPKGGTPIKTKNIILYGAPGVGKTHNTNKLIQLIEDGESQSEIFKAIGKNEHTDSVDISNIKDRVKFVTFHQSFGYEDFIEGFRPNNEGQIKIERGIFHKICEDAKLNILESQKNIDTLKKEKLNQTKFKKFIEYLHLNNISQITDTVSITNTDDNAFYYSSHTGAMKNVRLPFSDIKECINKNVSSLDDITNLNNISGTSRQRPTYPFKIVELYNNFIKNDLSNIVETDSISKIERKNYYLVIDEINRGNISKIFGELITLIEEDKREKIEVTLPYSKEPFKVPSNLFIIGTMNSTDKSIALIDIALRRRFTFLKMKPNEVLVPEIAKNIFNAVNTKILESIGEDYQIGHSYFMNISDKDDLKFVLEYKITPLLEEYFYGNKEQLNQVLEIVKG